MVNIVLEDAEKRLLTVSRLALKTQGAKAGLLFVFDAEEASAEGFLDRFSCYDAWTAENYNTMKAERWTLVHVHTLCLYICVPSRCSTLPG